MAAEEEAEDQGDQEEVVVDGEVEEVEVQEEVEDKGDEGDINWRLCVIVWLLLTLFKENTLALLMLENRYKCSSLNENEHVL